MPQSNQNKLTYQTKFADKRLKLFYLLYLITLKFKMQGVKIKQGVLHILKSS